MPPPLLGTSEPGFSPEHELDRVQVLAAWAVAETAEARACNNAIDKDLFCTGTLCALLGRRRLHFTAEFDAYVQRWYQPLTVDAKAVIDALGVCPVAFRELENGDLAPFVPPPLCYSITTYSPGRGRQAFRFYWRPINAPPEVRGEYDASVVVLSNFGHTPTLAGELRSNGAALVAQIAFAERMRASALTAERVLRAPPLMLEASAAYANEEEEMRVRGGYYGAAASTDAARADDTSYTRATPQQRAQLRQNLRLYQRINGVPSLRAAFGVAEEPDEAEEHASACLVPPAEPGAPAQFYVPRTRTLSSAAALPSRDPALATHIDRVQAIVCRVLGVPLATLAGESSARAGADVAADSLLHTVRHWASLLADIVTAAYYHVFGREDFRRKLQEIVSASTARRADFQGSSGAERPRFASEDDVFAADAATRIVFEFDVAPIATTETMRELYLDSVIDWDAYAHTSVQLAGLPAAYAQPNDGWSTADRHAMLLPPTEPSASSGGGGGSSSSSSSTTGATRHSKRKASS